MLVLMSLLMLLLLLAVAAAAAVVVEVVGVVWCLVGRFITLSFASCCRCQQPLPTTTHSNKTNCPGWWAFRTHHLYTIYYIQTAAPSFCGYPTFLTNSVVVPVEPCAAGAPPPPLAAAADADTAAAAGTKSGAAAAGRFTAPEGGAGSCCCCCCGCFGSCSFCRCCCRTRRCSGAIHRSSQDDVRHKRDRSLEFKPHIRIR